MSSSGSQPLGVISMVPILCPDCHSFPLHPALGASIPHVGTAVLMKTKQKDVLAYQILLCPRKKKINQQKHHDQSSHQDKGRLPCLKRSDLYFALTLLTCQPG